MDPTVITELAKALGTPIETAVRLFEKFAGPAADELGKYVADKVRVYRFKNQLATLKKADQMVAEAGFTRRAVPMKLLFPLVDGASLEDDGDMQIRWAALLANAAHPKPEREVLPSFLSILKELTPREADHLEWLYSLEAGVNHAERQNDPDFAIHLENLDRLNLIQLQRGLISSAEVLLVSVGPTGCVVHRTELGFAFLEACRPPAKRIS